jgi:23S rRNA (uridine2552-2'-O)-methyltransferase
MGFKVKDHYFNKAKKEQYLARSVYKLEEIDKKFKVLKKKDLVLDLGYYPGSWVQYAHKIAKSVIGVDIKEVNKKILNLNNVTLFQKDAFEIEDISELGVDSMFDVILSDMAPDTTGIKSVDQDRSLALVEKVFGVLPTFLKKGGNLVIKVFDGNDAQIFLKSNKKLFETFNYFRPKSTRSVSKEFFVIGKGYKG